MKVMSALNAFVPVKVLFEYAFGMVVEASVKKMAEVVEKKLVADFQ